MEHTPRKSFTRCCRLAAFAWEGDRRSCLPLSRASFRAQVAANVPSFLRRRRHFQNENSHLNPLLFDFATQIKKDNKWLLLQAYSRQLSMSKMSSFSTSTFRLTSALASAIFTMRRASFLTAVPTKRAKTSALIAVASAPVTTRATTKKLGAGAPLDWGANKVYLRSKTHRVVCPEHGVVTAAVPWAFADSRFTKNFDLTVTWLASRLSKSGIVFYMDIDRKTVDRCIRRTLDHIEPNQSDRLKGLVNIGVDETSLRKGHK